MTNTRFYKTYESLKARCENKNNNRYYKYGARGIKCTWDNFTEFRDDMYVSYLSHVEKYGEKDTTIDRIDNNGNYEKANCRWATRSEQIRNRDYNQRFITFRGKTKRLCEWCEELGVNNKVVWARIFTYGWSVERALTTK